MKFALRLLASDVPDVEAANFTLDALMLFSRREISDDEDVAWLFETMCPFSSVKLAIDFLNLDCRSDGAIVPFRVNLH